MITVNQDKLKTHKNKLAKSNREQAYKTESDPIFFLWQRSEATEQDWKNKIAEIKERFPYE